MIKVPFCFSMVLPQKDHLYCYIVIKSTENTSGLFSPTGQVVYMLHPQWQVMQ